MVLNAHLQVSLYVAGDKFTIADIACIFWVHISPATLGLELESWPAIKKWHDVVLQRGALQKAMRVPESKMTEEQFAGIMAKKRQAMTEKVNTDLH
jgi:glutathione S-transferase